MPFIQPCLYNIYIYTHISQSVVLEGDNIPNYADFLCLFANKNKRLASSVPSFRLLELYTMHRITFCTAKTREHILLVEFPL